MKAPRPDNIVYSSGVSLLLLSNWVGGYQAKKLDNRFSPNKKMEAEEFTSVTTSSAEFNLITDNSSLTDIWIDVKWSFL